MHSAAPAEPGSSASSDASSSSSRELLPYCGNGSMDANEECDDGGSVDGDGCSSACKLEKSAKERCGNGILDIWETCDAGGGNSDTAPDACRTTCRLAFCGDGVVDRLEQCDDGNDILGDGCTTTCVKSLCGNGVLELGEECDDGKGNSDDTPDTCSKRCLVPRCGDRIVDRNFGERCDEGELNSNEVANTCRMDCSLPRCGDGVIDVNEECDDRNATDNDACSNDCMLPVCGDGVVEGSEQCDDQNALSDDGCSRECMSEAGAAASSTPADAQHEAAPGETSAISGGISEGSVLSWMIFLFLVIPPTAYLAYRRMTSGL